MLLQNDLLRRLALTALAVVLAAADRLMHKDKELREAPRGKVIVTRL